jgi:hypothetical protein
MYRGPGDRRAPVVHGTRPGDGHPWGTERHFAVLVAVTDGSAVRDVHAPRPLVAFDSHSPRSQPEPDEAGRPPLEFSELRDAEPGGARCVSA